MMISQLVVLSTFPSVADAQLAQGVLEDVGIESMVRTDDGGGMYPGIGGAELLVRVEDADRATEALNAPAEPGQ
jgi:hypothetical protein